MARSRETNGDTLREPLEQYLHEIAETDLLSPDEEYRLARHAKHGNAEARDLLIRANLRLVVNIARRYRNKGLDFEDLIQEGNKGLMRAIKKFDRKLGYRFNTYASWWIRQAITSALSSTSRNVEIPAYMIELLGKFREAEKKLTVDLGRQVTPREVIATMGLPKEKAGLLLQARCAQQHPVRDTREGDKEEESFGIESIEDDEPETIQLSITREHREKLRALLPLLEPREQEVLRWRYGLDAEYNGGRGMTLEQVARLYKITRERIRQIESKAIKKLINLVNNPRYAQNLYTKKMGSFSDPI